MGRRRPHHLARKFTLQWNRTIILRFDLLVTYPNTKSILECIPISTFVQVAVFSHSRSCRGADREPPPPHAPNRFFQSSTPLSLWTRHHSQRRSSNYRA